MWLRSANVTSLLSLHVGVPWAEILKGSCVLACEWVDKAHSKKALGLLSHKLIEQKSIMSVPVHLSFYIC